MARTGAFPKLFAKVPPAYKTPTHAIFAQYGLTLATGLSAGAWFHPDVAFFLLTGLVLVLGVSFVYLMANVGVIVYYWRERHPEFNWLWHAALPVASSLVLVYALAESFPPFCPSQNCPVDPYAKAPLVAGGWLVVGILLLVYYAMSKREQWLKTAGGAPGDREGDRAAPHVGGAGGTARG